MSRAREESPFDDSPSKRIPIIPNNKSLQHYDIYLIPSSSHLIPSSSNNTLPPPPPILPEEEEEINSVAFLVVSQQSNLETGLGIAYSLLYSPPPPTSSSNPYGTIIPIKNLGFSLRREENYDVKGAVQLGWVEESSFLISNGTFEKILLDSSSFGSLGDYMMMMMMMKEGSSGPGGTGIREIGRKIVRDWLIYVMSQFEFNGICCNGDLLASKILSSLLN